MFGEAFMIKVVAAGLFFGLCSFMLIYSLHAGRKLFDKIKMIEPLKGITGGILLVGLVFASSPQYLGLGLKTTENALGGGDIIWYAFIMKIVFTSITFKAAVRGIVTPIFFIGATAGTLFAKVWDWTLQPLPRWERLDSWRERQTRPSRQALWRWNSSVSP